MNFAQTLGFLFSQLPMFQRQGAAAYKANLDNTIHFCDYLGNPESAYPSIHVAGTNGKGSVSHMTASYLQESSCKVGLYTSPHLKDFRERIRVNGEMVSEKFVVDFVEEHLDFISELKPSFFEITFAMAIQYFKEQGVDYAVMETGMGGRLDSTNVVNSILSVITNISLDHTQFLGDSIEKIAKEKAGIIKHQIPVIIGQKQASIMHVFIEMANQLNSPIYFAEDLIHSGVTSHTNNLLELDMIDLERGIEYSGLRTPLAGDYQVSNIRTFLAIASVLEKHNIVPLSKPVIYSALEKVITNTGMQGRWQTLNEKPLIIADTGHNEAGLKYIVQQLERLNYKKLHFVLGMVSDKEIDQLLKMLPSTATYYFCKADIPRALDANTLYEKAKSVGLSGKVYTSVSKAYDAAKSKADENDLVFVGGSTFVVAEVL